MFDFSSRCILVTGSTRGIGRAIARRLLAAGAVVGIHGRDAARCASAAADLQAETGGAAFPLHADLEDPTEAGRLVARFRESAGRLDGLVNNAGGGRAMAFRGMTLERWRRTFAVNLEAAVLASRQAYLIMREQQAGAIVNIASISAHGPGKWMGADYAASKAGLVSLTRSLAFEAGRMGVRVNAVSPGVIETDMTGSLTDAMREDLGVPMGRLGRPEEVAEAAAFLLSDLAAYITGEVLHVNGGLLI